MPLSVFQRDSVLLQGHLFITERDRKKKFVCMSKRSVIYLRLHTIAFPWMWV